MRSAAIACTGPGAITVVEEPERAPGPDEVKIRTLYSGVSAGTELSTYRGTNPHLTRQWEPERRLFTSAEARPPAYPVLDWGYEEVGEIVELGAAAGDVAPGALVYGTWGHRTHHIAPAAWARKHLLPAELDPIFGIFSHIGAVALNGTLETAVRIGETAAVFGLGVVGRLVARLLQLSGAAVIGVDLVPLRLEAARTAGISAIIDAGGGRAAEQIKSLTEGRGADVCVEAAGSTAALNEAIRACAYSSKVVALGFYQGEASKLYLGEEFHHNRIQIVSSQIGGLPAELQHRWDRLRLVHTFMRLAADGRLELRPLITHVVPASRAAELFETLDRDPGVVLQAVLDFRDGIEG